MSGLNLQERTLPRPTISVSNIWNATANAERKPDHSWNDLNGAKLTRIRTLARFLDAVNFAPNCHSTSTQTVADPSDAETVTYTVLSNLVEMFLNKWSQNCYTMKVVQLIFLINRCNVDILKNKI